MLLKKFVLVPWTKKDTCPPRLCGTTKIHCASWSPQIDKALKIGIIGKIAIRGNPENENSASSLTAKPNIKYLIFEYVLVAGARA